MDYYSFIYIMIRLMYFFLTKRTKRKHLKCSSNQYGYVLCWAFCWDIKDCSLQCMSSIEGRNKNGQLPGARRKECSHSNATTQEKEIYWECNTNCCDSLKAVCTWSYSYSYTTLAGAINILMTRVVSQYNGPSGLDRPLTILRCDFAWSSGPQQAKYLAVLHS